MALDNLISVITGRSAEATIVRELCDIDLFATFTVRIPIGERGNSVNLWNVENRKYGDQQLDKQTGMRADSEGARRARVEALRQAYEYCESEGLERSPFGDE